MKINVQREWYQGGLEAVFHWKDDTYKVMYWRCPHENMNGYECLDCGGYYD